MPVTAAAAAPFPARSRACAHGEVADRPAFAGFQQPPALWKKDMARRGSPCLDIGLDTIIAKEGEDVNFDWVK